MGPHDEENDLSASDVRMFHCVLSAVDDEPEPFELATRAAEEDDVVGEDVLLEMKACGPVSVVRIRGRRTHSTLSDRPQRDAHRTHRTLAGRQDAFAQINGVD